LLIVSQEIQKRRKRPLPASFVGKRLIPCEEGGWISRKKIAGKGVLFEGKGENTISGKDPFRQIPRKGGFAI